MLLSAAFFNFGFFLASFCGFAWLGGLACFPTKVLRGLEKFQQHARALIVINIPDEWGYKIELPWDHLMLFPSRELRKGEPFNLLYKR